LPDFLSNGPRLARSNSGGSLGSSPKSDEKLDKSHIAVGGESRSFRSSRQEEVMPALPSAHRPTMLAIESPRLSQHTSLHGNSPTSNDSVEAVGTEMLNAVNANPSRLLSTFLKYDSRQSGQLRAHDFIRAIQSTHPHIDEELLGQVVHSCANQRGDIDYANFMRRFKLDDGREPTNSHLFETIINDDRPPEK